MKLRSIYQLFNSVWAIDPAYAESYLPFILSYLKGEFMQFPVSSQTEDKPTSLVGVSAGVKGGFFVSPWARSGQPEVAPENSIAIHSFSDVITKYDQECGDVGTNTKSDLISRADMNPNIKGHIVLLDTPGGEAYAGMQASQAIKGTSKPIVAFVDDLAASAGYMIATNADYIVANQSMARIGSIGTFITLADRRKYFENQGIKLIDIYADASVDKNLAYRDAIEKGEFGIIKHDLNKINEQFISMVEQNRTDMLQKNRDVWGTGKMYFADEAMKLGLIDDIATLQETVSSLLN